MKQTTANDKRTYVCTNDVASPSDVVFSTNSLASLPLICYNTRVGGEDVEHKEYVRINDYSKTAILFIHGIVGTPNHFNEFVSLVPESFSVYNLLLEGHGKGVKDFSNASMKKWEAQVDSVVKELSLTHEKIYIVAHSLGTLLAIDQAVKNKKNTSCFFLQFLYTYR